MLGNDTEKTHILFTQCPPVLTSCKNNHTTSQPEYCLMQSDTIFPPIRTPLVSHFYNSIQSPPEQSLICSVATAAAKLLQSCPTLCDPIDGNTRLPRPWDSPGKNTGVGCHFLLQCMKVKSEVAQSCPILATPWTAAYQAPPSTGSSRQK